MDQILPKLLVRTDTGGDEEMKIGVFGYDADVDELDILIDCDVPEPAESIPVGSGIYVRRDPATGRVVGAFIRGYAQFVRDVREGSPVSTGEAKRLGLGDVVEAIVEWQREANRLSKSLSQYLGDPEPAAELVDLLLAA